MPIEIAQAIQENRRGEVRAELAQLLVGRTTITLEIGCGHGHYLAGYATANPGEYCLGLDISAERVDRTARKLSRLPTRNAQVIRAEAAMVIEELPVGIALERVLILFPDPWPKRRHWKNRLLQASFLSALAARCAPNAQLCFRTDHEPYFESSRASVAGHERWRLEPDHPWPFEQETVFQARAPSFRSWVAVRL